jgi:hydroxymethylbilane synthase
MRVRILSRASDLAVLQGALVANVLRAAWPDVEVLTETRSSQGDRDVRAALWALPDKGLFTADLSEALVAGDADLVVHSWKDLPIESPLATVVGATIERADPRDVLVVRRDVIAARPSSLKILSSSPRRAFQLQASLAPLLPWPIASVAAAPVRGNVPTRLARLVAGDGDALVVAKAALDRLLGEASPHDARVSVRAALDQCQWMVLPAREFPTAAAQGAIAIEVAASRRDLQDRLARVTHAPTWQAVLRERAILQSFGGGCHAAVGVTVLQREYGRVTSVRAHVPGSPAQETWTLEPGVSCTARVTPAEIWPRPEERARVRRRPIDVVRPAGEPPLWVSRADALPTSWNVPSHQLVWAAGRRTWARLAARGVWVHGSAEGLGDRELPDVDRLAGSSLAWRRLSHAGSGDPEAIATYEVEHDLPADLSSRRQFYWTSGSLFLEALAAHPGIAAAQHASGPGRTARLIRETLGDGAHPHVWLEYEQWHHAVTS